MTAAAQSMRDEFEAHMRSTTLSNCERLADGDYLNHHIQHGWDIWQAATKKEREACAVVGDAMAVEYRALYKGRTEPIDRAALYDPHMDGMSDGASNVADAIRGRGEAGGPKS